MLFSGARPVRGRKSRLTKGPPIPFPFLAILLVLLIVALLFVAYYLTRRW